MKPPVIEAWHKLMDSESMDELEDLLADDVVFQSPVVHTPQEGKAITALYLKSAGMMFKANTGFHYENEWYSENSAVLEFEAEINGIKINGVDMIFWNKENKIERFRVMLRPLKAVNLVHEFMGKLLAANK
ncbi:MAG: nuclear transport factor 2 family protein [Pseudomonadales bacterium]|nr:nuclear transport factor 2 family protein [Pseudomonadales bacterium]